MFLLNQTKNTMFLFYIAKMLEKLNGHNVYCSGSANYGASAKTLSAEKNHRFCRATSFLL